MLTCMLCLCQAEDAIQQGVEEWNPKDDPHAQVLSSHMHVQLTCAAVCSQVSNTNFAQGDAFKTLFVSRISFETTEKKLRREFEEYGPIKRIRLVHDATGKRSHLDCSPVCTNVMLIFLASTEALLCMYASSAGMTPTNMSSQVHCCSLA